MQLYYERISAMKNNFGIKLQLMGIALIGFIPFTLSIQNGDDFISSVFATIGVFTPFIGLILCIVGLFYKEK